MISNTRGFIQIRPLTEQNEEAIDQDAPTPFLNGTKPEEGEEDVFFFSSGMDIYQSKIKIFCFDTNPTHSLIDEPAS